MSWHGDIRLGDTIDIKFTTRRFTTGAPFTLAGTPALAAYPGNSITEITAGITLTVDFDARTGLNNIRVVASGANGYATATTYYLVITAGTVDSVSVVGEVVGGFSIEHRSALMPTTAARTLDVNVDLEAEVDVRKWLGTTAATPTTAGIPTVRFATAGVNDILNDVPPAFTGAPTTVRQLLYFVRQSWKNRLRYVKATDIMTLFEDDGTTAKFAYTMVDDATEATRGAGA